MQKIVRIAAASVFAAGAVLFATSSPAMAAQKTCAINGYLPLNYCNTGKLRPAANGRLNFFIESYSGCTSAYRLFNSSGTVVAGGSGHTITRDTFFGLNPGTLYHLQMRREGGIVSRCGGDAGISN